MRVILKPAGVFLLVMTLALLVFVTFASASKVIRSRPLSASPLDTTPIPTPIPLSSEDARAVHVNLEEMGKRDWVLWSNPDHEIRRASNNPQKGIGKLEIWGTVQTYESPLWALAYAGNNGQPTNIGLCVQGVGNGFRFAVNPPPTTGKLTSAGTGDTVLHIFTSTYRSVGSLTARFGDTLPLTTVTEETQEAAGGYVLHHYQVRFPANSRSNLPLTVTYAVGGGAREAAVMLYGAALE